jgi:hypothetical protein
VVARLCFDGVDLGLVIIDRIAVLDESEVRTGFTDVSSLLLAERLRLGSFFDGSTNFSFFISGIGWDSIRSLR